MEDPLEMAKTYRDRAAETRAVAELARRTETFNMLMKVAADYEAMAKSLEAIADSKTVLDEQQNMQP